MKGKDDQPNTFLPTHDNPKFEQYLRKLRCFTAEIGPKCSLSEFDKLELDYFICRFDGFQKIPNWVFGLGNEKKTIWRFSDFEATAIKCSLWTYWKEIRKKLEEFEFNYHWQWQITNSWTCLIIGKNWKGRPQIQNLNFRLKFWENLVRQL